MQKLQMNSDVREIYRKLMHKLRKAVEFEECMNFLQEFFPVSDVDEIRRRQDFLRVLFEKSSILKDKTILKVEKPDLTPKRLRDRVLIVEEEEDYGKAVELDICDVNVEGEYPLVIYSDELREIAVEEIAPEYIVMELYEKRDSLERVKEVIEAIRGMSFRITEFKLENVDEGHGSKGIEDKNNLSVVGKILEEILTVEDILTRRNTSEEFEEFVYIKLEEIRRNIEEKVSDEEITLSGKEVLEYLKNKSGFEDKFRKIEDIIFEEVTKAENDISEKFGVSVEVFTRESYPEINFDILERVKRDIEREFVMERYHLCREVVRRIKISVGNFVEKIDEEFDLYYLIVMGFKLQKFFRNWVFPEIEEDIIYFKSGRNLFIESPQPISYCIGNGIGLSGFSNFNSLDEEQKKKRIIVLTGANSGGKTSLLNLIVQIQLLFQMGFPVPAEEAKLDVLEEIYFFMRKKTVYGAGAFESTLKNFTTALLSGRKKLILVDEFEAITEPGAAVKMLTSFLRLAHERNFYMIVVSHMAEDLKLDFVRVDGIEASGLDENLNLIVERQPLFNKFGKSTPELIVERVYRMSKGGRRKILEHVLKSLSFSQD
jgi:hypothetical protein